MATARPISTMSWTAFGLTGSTSWLKIPRMPKAAISDVIARTSGTTDAATAPNATMRMMNVAGIVRTIELSRSCEIRLLMSSLMNVELMTWMVVVGWAARAASMIGRTGTSSFRTWGFSPGILPTIRIADPSADVSSASGGALSGSMSSVKLAVETPSTSAFAAPRAATRSLTVARKAGSVAAPGPAESTTTKRSNGGSDVPPAPKTSYAFWASTVSSFGFPLASRLRIPPIWSLSTKMPIVTTNQRTITGQRWRALHIAIRTVAGSREAMARGGARRAIGRHGAWCSSIGGRESLASGC